MDLRIELAREEDVPRILEISNWAAENLPFNFATEPEPLESWLASWHRTSKFHPWFVARNRSGGIMGFAR